MTSADEDWDSHRPQDDGRRRPAHAKTSPRWPGESAGSYPAQGTSATYPARSGRDPWVGRQDPRWTNDPRWADAGPTVPAADYAGWPGQYQDDYYARPDYPGGPGQRRADYPDWTDWTVNSGGPVQQQQPAYPGWQEQQRPAYVGQPVQQRPVSPSWPTQQPPAYPGQPVQQEPAYLRWQHQQQVDYPGWQGNSSRSTTRPVQPPRPPSRAAAPLLLRQSTQGTSASTPSIPTTRVGRNLNSRPGPTAERRSASTCEHRLPSHSQTFLTRLTRSRTFRSRSPPASSSGTRGRRSWATGSSPMPTSRRPRSPARPAARRPPRWRTRARRPPS